MEVLDLIGPLYRQAVRAVEAPAPVAGLPVGVRAVVEALAVTGQGTVPQLARGLALTRQFVQRSVDDAARRGLVETLDNPAHRRSRLVRLTPTGRETLTGMHAREHEILARVGGGTLTDGQLRACTTVLAELLAVFRTLSPRASRR